MLALTQALLLWVLGAGLVGWMGADGWSLLWVAVRLLVGTAFQGLFVLLLLYAVLSWVQPHSPVYGWLSRLLGPLLAPIRQHLPLVGGVDLSPLVLLLAVQVALMLVG
ncbi:MAG: YggT family protein [Anaerolineae bacterium]|nr:YggT family protein [Anaerolineae bacterium]